MRNAPAGGIAAGVRGVPLESPAGQGEGGRTASPEPLADQVRRFCEDLERQGRDDWQVRQAEQALRMYFINFLRRTDWNRRPQSEVVDEAGRTSPPAALEQLRLRLRTRTTPIAPSPATPIGCVASSPTWRSARAHPTRVSTRTASGTI